MAATQTPSSARELQGPLFGLLLLILLLLLLLSLLRLQERILKLDEDMKWWKERCKWFQGEYYRGHATLRTGDCHVRISSSLTGGEDLARLSSTRHSRLSATIM